MSRLPLIKEEDAPGNVAGIFADIRREMGIPFVPNFFKSQGVSSAVLSASWGAAHHILIGGVLPRPLKEMMFVASSVARDCRYCAEVHLAFCKMIGLDEETMSALVRDLNAISPQRARDIVKFAVKCATNPIAVTDADYETVRRHGVSDLELMEILGVAALAAFFDTIADALRLEIDVPVIEILGGEDYVARQRQSRA
jgi:uncharacterized peroxidase-related enzyme